MGSRENEIKEMRAVSRINIVKGRLLGHGVEKFGQHLVGHGGQRSRVFFF